MRRLVPLVVVLAVALCACRVNATVTVKVDGDGSGVVTGRVVLDRDAVRAAESGGAKLEDAVRLGDLAAAGWKSSGWKRLKSGGATLAVSKSFARPEEASAVVAELNGPDGPVRELEVNRAGSQFRTEWSLKGLADLKEVKTGIGGDADLVARLTGERVDLAALDQRLLFQTRDALRLQVVSDLPGASARVFTVPPGKTVAMRDSSSRVALGKVLLFVGGFVFAVAGVVIFVAGEARDRRKRQEQATT